MVHLVSFGRQYSYEEKTRKLSVVIKVVIFICLALQMVPLTQFLTSELIPTGFKLKVNRESVTKRITKPDLLVPRSTNCTTAEVSI